MSDISKESGKKITFLSPLVVNLQPFTKIKTIPPNQLKPITKSVDCVVQLLTWKWKLQDQIMEKGLRN